MLVPTLLFIYIMFSWLLHAAMMEANYESNSSKIKKMEHVSVPPGFASLTSFYLKRDEKVNKTDKSTNIVPNEIYTHRPWILLDQSSKHKPQESHNDHLPMVKLVICKKSS